MEWFSGLGILGAIGFAVYGSLVVVPISIIIGIVAQSATVALVSIILFEATLDELIAAGTVKR